MIDVGEAVAHEPGHLRLGEGRLGEHLAEQLEGDVEVAGRHLQAEVDAAFAGAGAPRDPVPLHQVRELFVGVQPGALVQRARHEQGRALGPPRLVRDGCPERHAQRENVLARQVHQQQAEPARQEHLVRLRERPHCRRRDGRAVDHPWRRGGRRRGAPHTRSCR
ncbi:hypothetical protein [Ornithinimicrobium pratense]|uniref:Uncharacterized protein n=1 Tax=Ornithinimicrobium pratense TaxID=2593973 RepID=A0A5J6V828_9MICO|nr:hypothetical protein [Ornithinimicrobium pratense]QFG69162.1 hypothetical protein FY030_11000 [Ornithinimicrobium pratense]